MLTPTDVHYLVGLLTMSSNPEDVEVELGSLVYDSESEEERDVDVTVTRREDNDEISAYSGIEVKKHKRPLDSTHVEQLCCKLNDMPSLTNRAIVSASGFYRPAVKKAGKKGVELYELKDWVERDKGFAHFQSEFVPAIFRSLNWFGEIKTHINPNNKIRIKDKDHFLKNPTIYFGNNKIKNNCANLNALMKIMQIKAQNELLKKWNPPNINSDERKYADITILISDKPYVKAPSGKIIIEELNFNGLIGWQETQQETHYKILQKYGEDKPDAGCCVFEMPGWGLCGLIVSNSNRDLNFIIIPISNRNKTKIFREKPVKVKHIKATNVMGANSPVPHL